MIVSFVGICRIVGDHCLDCLFINIFNEMIVEGDAFHGTTEAIRQLFVIACLLNDDITAFKNALIENAQSCSYINYVVYHCRVIDCHKNSIKLHIKRQYYEQCYL